MENSSQNPKEQTSSKHSSPHQRRGRKAFKPDDFSDCPSPFCLYIADMRKNKWGMKIALCCKTLVSTRVLKASDHPQDQIQDLFKLISHKGCSEHEAFHQFLKAGGQKLTIEKPHSEQPEVIFFSSSNMQKKL